MARTVINGPDPTYLLQENGDQILLETGDIMLTEETPTGGGRTVLGTSRVVIGTTRGAVTSRTVI